MTQPKICLKNKFGFCKYSERCFYQHVSTVCDDYKCDVYKCEKRHPRICRYYRDFQRCKFTVVCKFKRENQYEVIKKIRRKKLRKSNVTTKIKSWKKIIRMLKLN